MKRKSKSDKRYRAALLYGSLWKSKPGKNDKYFTRVTWSELPKTDTHSKAEKNYLMWAFKMGYLNVKQIKK